MQLPPKEEEKIATALKEIAEKEAKEMDAKGMKGTEFMEIVLKVTEKYIKK